jgi:hypothetical protein
MKTILTEVLTNPDARTATTLAVVASQSAEAFYPWNSLDN